MAMRLTSMSSVPNQHTPIDNQPSNILHPQGELKVFSYRYARIKLSYLLYFRASKDRC
jgi:hypothetical protein